MAIGPVVLKHVAVDDDVLRVLELKQVFDCPMLAGVSRVADFPALRFENVIAADLDVGWHETRDARIGAPKHDVLARAFQVVVDDAKRSGTIPAADRLRVVADAVNLRDVRVADGRVGAVESYATLHVLRGPTVNVRTIDDDMMRHLAQTRLFAPAVAEADQIVDHDVRIAAKLEADKAIVMRTRNGFQDRLGRYGRLDLREQR